MPPRTRAEPRVIARWGPAILLGLTLCAGPLWLWRVSLPWFFLKSDDFVYLAWSRSPAALREHVAASYQGHVAPLFMLETHLLARLAGTLEALPTVLGWASYANLVLAMAAIGRVVAWETGRTARGLAAMAAVGFSSVLGPTLLWFAAGQALAAGTIILAMLTALQTWRIRGSWWPLVLGLLAAAAAPLIWSAGYAAAPVGMAYLWADGRRPCRRAAALLAACTLALIMLVWCVVGRGFAPASHVAARPLGGVLAADAVLTHSAQAVCEALILNNLGVDAPTTAVQGLLICTLLIGIWAWSRRRSGPTGSGLWLHINPLEAAGAVLVMATLGLIFASRGTESDYNSLRGLGWYDAMAELGAVLFVAGWRSGRLPSPPSGAPEPPGRRELLAVLMFAAGLMALQAPRAHRVIFEYDGASAPLGADSTRAGPPRTSADLVARAADQRRALAELDRLEPRARRGEIGRAAVRRAIDRASVPGMPAPLPGFDPADLLEIPVNPMNLREAGSDRR
jgi:hypothetical protein